MGKKEFAGKTDKSKTALAVTLTVFAVIYVFLVVLLSIVCHATDLGVGKGSMNNAYGTVLGDIDNITVANPRVIDIAMLGSHDAMSDQLDPYGPIDYADKDGILGKIDPITKGFQYRFGVTQSVSIGQQLMQGSRWLHIKYTNYDGVWYGTHAHLSNTIEYYVTEILTFLESHPGELVLIEFQPMYFGGETYATFHEWLSGIKVNGKNIYDYVHYDDVDVFREGDGGVQIGELRYNDVTVNGEEAGVLLLDRRESPKIYKPEHDAGQKSAYCKKFFDMDKNSIHTWHSRSSSKALIEKIGETADKIQNSDEFDNLLRVNQTQASFSGASFGDIMHDLFDWSLLKIAKKHNVRLIEHSDFDRWLALMPVFQVDYVNSDYGDFNAKANAKIRAYNEALCAVGDVI